MNWLTRGLLRPHDNRHYVGRRLHMIRFTYSFIPMAIVCVVGFISSANLLWLLGLVALCSYGIFVYYTFDKAKDKVLWDTFYKHHFKAPKAPPEYQEMKAYEANPSKENKVKLEKKLQEK